MANQYKPIILHEGKLAEKVQHHNFSYKLIDENILIASGQQMIVKDRFHVIDGFGVLVNGEVFVETKETPAPPVSIPDDNFSHFIINTNKTVPSNQEMCVRQYFKVTNGAGLKVAGRVSIVNEYNPVIIKRVKKIIEANEIFEVPLNEEYYFRGWLKVSGKLKNNGFIFIGV